MFSKFNNKFSTPILLVSKSPRRAELLQQAGYQFDPYALEVSEITDENLNCLEQCLDLARLKMRHFINTYGLKSKDYSFALTCDTMVEFEGRVLGKPKDKNEALVWLKSYSGKEQLVHTGCCLLKLDGRSETEAWVSSTKVLFRTYSEHEAKLYLDTEKDVLSKAGGYGIQDESFNLVERIEGEFSNVVGLPLEELSKRLKKWM